MLVLHLMQRLCLLWLMRFWLADTKLATSYSPEQLFNVVAAVDLYHGFVPWCQRSEILKYYPDGSFDAELEIGFKFLVESYISHVELKRPKYIKVIIFCWNLDSQFFRSYCVEVCLFSPFLWTQDWVWYDPCFMQTQTTFVQHKGYGYWWEIFFQDD